MANFAFFGTPLFAVPPLEHLIRFCGRYHHNLALVVCQPDQPKGRGLRLESPPVKQTAQKHNLSVLQPTTLKKGTEEGDHFLTVFQQHAIDLAIVVAYGKLIPKRILDIPTKGFVNIHASLLPRWRGAAPIHRAILEGDKETGVCIMEMTPELDAGGVYKQSSIPIEANDTTLSLSQKLSTLGAQTLEECLPALLDGTLKAIPQSKEGICYAHRLHKEEGQIRFDQTMEQIQNHHRAMQPWPGSYTYHKGQMLKILDLQPVFQSLSGKPGTVLSTKPQLLVGCKDGAIAISTLQAPGKRPMPASELIKGYSISIGDVFGRF